MGQRINANPITLFMASHLVAMLMHLPQISMIYTECIIGNVGIKLLVIYKSKYLDSC